MKKCLLLLPITAFLFISSCSSSSSFDSLMRKISKLVCKEKQLQRDIDNGKEEAKKELEKVKAEHEKLKEQIAKKFEKEKDDPQMRERALKIFNEEMAECK